MLVAVCATVVCTTAAESQEWQLLDGKAKDVGVGADGSVWLIGANQVAGGHDVWKRAGNGWTNVAGGGERIAVDPAGNAWIVNNTGNIFRFDGSRFVQVNGGARDIGIGANGTVWVIGVGPVQGGYGIWRSVDKGATWTNIPGGAERIAVDPAGNAWIVNNTNTIFRYDGRTFVQVAGDAQDVGVAPDGAVWVTRPNGSIARWNGSGWTAKSGGANQIAAGPAGTAWVVNAGGEIWKAQDQPEAGAATTVVLRRIFPRGQGYEARMLKALQFGWYGNQIWLGGTPPAASSLPALDQGFAQLALAAAEAYYASQPQVTADEVIRQVENLNDQNPRRGVTGYLGLLLAGKMLDQSRDAPTVALRTWATDLFRNQKITAAKSSLDEYLRWKNDPCGYEGKPAGECQTMANLFTTRTPPQDMIALKALNSVMGGRANEIAAATTIAAGAAAMTAAGAALTAALGTVVIQGSVTTGGVVISQVATSLFAAFGGTGGAAAGGAGAIGGAWASVVAAPIAAAVMVAVVGTMEGFKVVEAARVEPMLRLKLGAAMTENIVIENALVDQNTANFFFLGFENVAANRFAIPASNVAGEVRFYNQAGYVARFKLAYTLNGAPQSFSTSNLPVGRDETFAIPSAATNIVASGEWFDGINWKSLFTRSLPRPTMIGFTSYGTVFSPQVKDEYPEISNIIAAANELTVTQGGGYVAWIRVTYQQGSQTVTPVDNGSVGAGWRQVFTIPANATNIRLQAWSKTGLVWEPWKTIIDKQYPSPPNECIKVYGTTLDPKWNNECR